MVLIKPLFKNFILYPLGRQKSWTAMRRHFPVSNSQPVSWLGWGLYLRWGGRISGWWGDGRGKGGDVDQAAALKHAELISIVMSQARSESAVGQSWAATSDASSLVFLFLLWGQNVIIEGERKEMGYFVRWQQAVKREEKGEGVKERRRGEESQG